MSARADRIAGALLGLAAGDALGLPYENLSPRRAARLLPGPLRHRLLPGGRGLVSDDTDHACLVGQALLASGGDPARFERALAWRLRGWLLSLPPGVGWATLRACVKLLLLVPSRWRGVRSAGNGPLMRAPLLGVVAGDDDARLAAWVAASTRLTHRDPRALEAALCVALAARDGAAGRAPTAPEAAAWVAGLPERVAPLAGAPASDDLRRALDPVVDAARRGDEAAAVVRALGLERGVTGYALHTLPAVLACWTRRPADVRGVVTEVVALGGDADTTGAIAGALAGATAGAAAVPAEWLEGLCEWPRSVAWMRGLAGRLAARFPAGAASTPHGPGPAPVCWPALPLRNLVLLAVVLAHGVRRGLPPY